MDEHAGRTRSVWMDAPEGLEFALLGQHAAADVCIVGAGIAGLTTAYFLTQAGKSVIVLDDGPVASGETERTTAHLSNALDDRYTELERLHGRLGAQAAAESHTAAINVIERIVTEEQIECGFTRLDGYLFNAPGRPASLLDDELAAAHRAGLEDVELVERAPLVSFDTGPALLFPRQGQLHPVRYLAGLAAAVVRQGGRIFTGTHVAAAHGGESPHVETTGRWRVDANAVVVATNNPITDHVALQSRQTAWRTYVIAVAVPSGTVPTVLYWDTADPYHYVRLQPAAPGSGRPIRDLLIVGGEDHRTGQADDAERRFARLEDWTRQHFPMAAEVRWRWSGQVMEPADGLAFIGRDPGGARHRYVATGDSGHGMTHGTIAGRLLTDLISGRASRWESLYSPFRVRQPAAAEYLRENAVTAAQYLDWLMPGGASSESALAPGCGAVVRQGLSHAALYRDEAGQLHACSAVCPHLKGIVRWNDAEKTWDCPVHGSRFDAYGRVLNGPASTDLEPLHQPASAPRPSA